MIRVLTPIAVGQAPLLRMKYGNDSNKSSLYGLTLQSPSIYVLRSSEISVDATGIHLLCQQTITIVSITILAIKIYDY